MQKRMGVELPGYVTVAGAAERLRLAPRSVRDLIYTGRVPSARLGHRHFLRVTDVELERRRRLGLPLPRVRASNGRRATRRGQSDRVFAPRTDEAGTALPRRVPAQAASQARRERARQRAAELERWLRSRHAPGTPRLPFTTVELDLQPAACDACHRPVRAGGRMVAADAVDGAPAARLCLTCARRALLAWSDARRREAVAARRMAHDLGTTYTTLLESSSAAA
jgi:hypothetical protein